jgi:hypothetical protein
MKFPDPSSLVQRNETDVKEMFLFDANIIITFTQYGHKLHNNRPLHTKKCLANISGIKRHFSLASSANPLRCPPAHLLAKNTDSLDEYVLLGATGSSDDGS